jgi:DNA-binding response OmpR family regulator
VSATQKSACVRPPLPACILVADYDELLVDLIGFKLTAQGYTVLTASDGPAALATAIDHRPDLIVLGAMMPMLDGLEVLRRLRRDRGMGSTPVVIVTARRQDREVLSALALGADDYLVKPFMLEELLARIAKLLKRRRRSAA